MSAEEPAQTGAGRWPDISVVMPVRNDAPNVRAAVSSILEQDYPGRFDIFVAVGPSTDGTEEVVAGIARDDPRIHLVANPAGLTAAGLNAAIACSTGEIVARVDGHAGLCDGYLRRSVETLGQTGAVNVGGVQQAEGVTPFERAVAAAMTSRFGVGDSRFHYGGAPGPADTVYLGVFRRDALARVGGFDETLVRNQDYELNWRLREAGGIVWFDPSLRVRYRPRARLSALARQYFEYGQWKREMLRRHPRSLRWRQLAPPAALSANTVCLLVGTAISRRFLLVPSAYLIVTLVAATVASRGDPRIAGRLPLVFATMHHAWGAGFLIGPRGSSAQAALKKVTMSVKP
ncbi:MAG: glycosyltransferase family 2 protein [Acidimicrobiia bacterium]|nr:glycosyltransferase family 2 protein [Acidimicrobiia bacterium]